MADVRWLMAPDLGDEATRRELSPARWKFFARPMRIWQVSEEEARQLFGVPFARLPDNLDGVQLGKEQLMRISYSAGIAKALRTLYGGEFARQWVRLPNSNAIFGAHTPLVYMADGGIEALERVRRLLGARCAGN